MFEPTEHEVDDALRRSMEMFERSKIGEAAPIEPRQPKKLLLVLDASAQDETSVSLAEGLRQRFSCEISVVDAREQIHDNALAERVAGELQAVANDKPEGDSFEQVLQAIGASACDLAVVPCPYGRALEKVGADSTGTVIDVLLARSPVPLLVVRHPYEGERPLFANLVIPLIAENKAAPLAVQWATGLVAPHGNVAMMLVMEENVIENIQGLIQAIDSDADVTPEVLENALAKSYVFLNRSLQKTAAARDFQSHFAVRSETEDVFAEAPHERQPLVVLALERGDRSSHGYVHDRIRRSPYPLLIVAQHEGRAD